MKLFVEKDVRNGTAVPLVIGAMLAARIASATGIEEASACGIDPLKSRFETTHYRGGDVTVVVAVDEDGHPKAALDPGLPASRIVATGRIAESILPASTSQDRLADMSAPERILVVCEPGRRKVAVAEPLASTQPLPGLEHLPAHSGWFCDQEAPKYFADPKNAGSDRFGMSAERVATAAGFERRTSWMAVSPAWQAAHPGTPACSLTQDLILCRDAARCDLTVLSPASEPAR